MRATMRESAATAAARAQFTEATAGHRLTVLHSDGLYRHLRMSANDTRVFSWDVVTWPGHLALSGDIADGYTFARDEDMIAFFRPRGENTGPLRINPAYWAEKLCSAQRQNVRGYSLERFLTMTRQSLLDLHGDDPKRADLIDRIVEQAEMHGDTAEQAHTWLSHQEPIVGTDTFEWDLTDFDHHFLLACFAVAATVRALDEHINGHTPNPNKDTTRD